MLHPEPARCTLIAAERQSFMGIIIFTLLPIVPVCIVIFIWAAKGPNTDESAKAKIRRDRELQRQVDETA